jgi:hypothetical protein
MKKLVVLALAASLLAPVCADAQHLPSPPPATPDEPFALLPSAEAGHSISINLLGVNYAYEHPIGRKASVIARAGLRFGMAGSTSGGGSWRTGTGIAYSSDFSWMTAPYIEVEPRWYYGFDRRESKGRSTEGNAGSFLSLRVHNSFPGYISDESLRIVGTTFFAPAWGLRRMWAEHWMFEFSVGYLVGFTHRDRWWNDNRLVHSLDLNVRFGYSF